jgi:hypothetical protein
MCNMDIITLQMCNMDTIALQMCNMDIITLQMCNMDIITIQMYVKIKAELSLALIVVWFIGTEIRNLFSYILILFMY